MTLHEALQQEEERFCTHLELVTNLLRVPRRRGIQTLFSDSERIRNILLMVQQRLADDDDYTALFLLQKALSLIDQVEIEGRCLQACLGVEGTANRVRFHLWATGILLLAHALHRHVMGNLFAGILIGSCALGWMVHREPHIMRNLLEQQQTVKQSGQTLLGTLAEFRSRWHGEHDPSGVTGAGKHQHP